MRHVIQYIKDHLKTWHHRKSGFIRGREPVEGSSCFGLTMSTGIHTVSCSGVGGGGD